MNESPVVKVIFKDEGDEHGMPIGPVALVRACDLDAQGRTFGRPFDRNRKPDPWLTLAQAEALAAEHGVPLEQA